MKSWSADSAANDDANSGQSQTWQEQPGITDNTESTAARTEEMTASGQWKDGPSYAQSELESSGNLQWQEIAEPNGEGELSQGQAEDTNFSWQDTPQGSTELQSYDDNAPRQEDNGLGKIEEAEGEQAGWADHEWAQQHEEQSWSEQAASGGEAGNQVWEGQENQVPGEASDASVSWSPPDDSGVVDLQSQPDMQTATQAEP